MELARQIAELPPWHRRRVRLVAFVAFPLTAVMTVGVVALSAASIGISWGRSSAEVALSVGLAVTAVVLCGVAGVNARRTLRAGRSAPPAQARGE
jgi:hypothetical protein